jgi:hypothetical protein
MTTTKRAELLAAVEQAQATLDRKRGQVERAQRYLDDCPDGDRRKADAEQRVVQLLREYHDAEHAATYAAEVYCAAEDADLGFGYVPGEDRDPNWMNP